MTRVISPAQVILDSTAEPSVALARLRSRLDLRSLHAESVLSEWPATFGNTGRKHDNGFDKIVLCASSRTKLKLVLHLWHPDQASDMDNIHNHRWDFASVVISGQLHSEIYHLRRSGKSYSSFSYSSPGDGQDYGFQKNGTVSASLQATLGFATGSSYTWGHDILHRAYGAGSLPSATIIVQGPPVQASTLVLLRAAEPPLRHQPVRHLTDGQMAAAMNVLLDPRAGAAWHDN